MVKNNKMEESIEYVNYGVSFYVLNEERFRKSFMFPEDFLRRRDRKKVNSILRPTLPDMVHSNGIKLPY